MKHALEQRSADFSCKLVGKSIFSALWGMAAHSTILAWRISWTEEPGDTERLTHLLQLLFCSYSTGAAATVNKQMGWARQIWPRAVPLSDRIQILDQWFFLYETSFNQIF